MTVAEGGNPETTGASLEPGRELFPDYAYDGEGARVVRQDGVEARFVPRGVAAYEVTVLAPIFRWETSVRNMDKWDKKVAVGRFRIPRLPGAEEDELSVRSVAASLPAGREAMANYWSWRRGCIEAIASMPEVEEVTVSVALGATGFRLKMTDGAEIFLHARGAYPGTWKASYGTNGREETKLPVRSLEWPCPEPGEITRVIGKVLELTRDGVGL